MIGKWTVGGCRRGCVRPFKKIGVMDETLSLRFIGNNEPADFGVGGDQFFCFFFLSYAPELACSPAVPVMC